MGSEPSPCCGSCQMIANASHWHLIYYAKTDPHTSQLLSPSPDVSVKEPRLRWGGRVPHTCNLVGTLDLVSSCLQLSTSHLVRMEGPQGGGQQQQTPRSAHAQIMAQMFLCGTVWHTVENGYLLWRLSDCRCWQQSRLAPQDGSHVKHTLSQLKLTHWK